MAAIDKIYLTKYSEYTQFKNWCNEQEPLEDKYGKKVHISKYLYDWNEWEGENEHPVFKAPCYVDAYVIRNCQFDFVQKAISINYGYMPQDWIWDWYNTVKNRTKEDQDIIDEFLATHDENTYSTPMRPDRNCIPCWWLTLDDFEIVDGIISCKKQDKSTYEKICEGSCHDYDLPYRENVQTGTHFTMVMCPRDLGYMNFQRPIKGNWEVKVESPDKYDYLWFNSNDSWDKGTWDFSEEFVDSDWASSSTFCPTVRSLTRRIKKWNLPVGTKVILTGRYPIEKYVFVIKK